MEPLPKAIRILPAPASGSVRVPASKSYTNRALLLAALAEGVSVIHEPQRSDDAEAMADALRKLGASVEDAGDHLVVRGAGGRLAAPPEPVYCRDSGTTIRFLAAAAALADGPVTLTGSEQLQRRPLGPLLDALSLLGVEASSLNNDGRPPVTIRGPLRAGSTSVDASGSSQYVSALIMALGSLPGAGARVEARRLVSTPYVAMTLDSMAAFGVRWTGEGAVFRPESAGGYRAASYTVEYDASAAGHILAVAALSGGRAAIENAVPTRQPDSAMASLLQSIRRDGGLVAPGEVNMADWPDMVSTVAVVAAFAEGTTVITGVGHARGHETDRLAATAVELRKMGVAVEETPGGLIVHGGKPRGAVIETYGDHRMAMAFAAAGAAIPGVVIRDPGCVRKTYPAFWDDLRRLGVHWEEVES